jgi:putative serine/threonine protein kinase
VGKPLQQQSEIAPLKRLLEKKYAEILCYPRYDLKEAKKRLGELRKLGVKALEFAGEKKVFDVYVLGKGYVGIVVAAYTNAGKAALKVRRVDADRAGMQHEAEMLRRANDVGVGPTLLNVTENFLLMKFIEGKRLPEWIETRRGREIKTEIRKVLRDVLEQCWRLDGIGLDHGELSRAPKHIIVNARNIPYLLDFETASISRKVSNVTSVCQFLFIGSQLAKTIQKKLGEVDTQTLIHILRAYKQKRTRENFEKVLAVCGLQS